MNEHELKSALRDVMVASSPPPPMDTGTAVAVGRKARARRRATWGGAVAGLAVVGIAVGATYLPSLTGGQVESAGPGKGSDNPIGVTGSLVPNAPANETGRPSAGAPGTETSWPDGQTDRTASNGPRADKSAGLVAGLRAALPPGLLGVDSLKEATSRTQSQFEAYTDTGGQVWEYLASTPVVATGGEKTGTLYVQITTAGNDFPADPCGATTRSWGIKGTCAVVDVDGKQVGVLTSDGGGSETEFDQLVAYRYDDGTVVFVAQAKDVDGSTLTPLDALPLTSQQLTALVTDPKFHLD
ncbi:hypothetical protein [Umezawaea sp. Da 62-37]|uniref:hypothetical protein n=1 Tax=Umezawaea sp. Da 62-37 TaxID=3075927 RepID=UPI0028F724FB|nr:hypothetical protein [Umezawaea sp. Da 62-37]WNV86327.1 hypothetical protein RM788_50825 [Umezawaea sp. Da 62-37]